jgi:hypothetical protein
MRTVTIISLLPVLLGALFPPGPALAASVPEVMPDKGLVVFYRPRRMTGAAITYSVDHANGTLGILTNGGVLYKYFEPGHHTFYSQVLSGDTVIIEVEAGKAYFVQGLVKLGVAVGRPNFKRVDEATGRAAVSGL